MKSEPKNIFSIPGQHNRNFFINSRYGGCPNDVGWMVITSNYCKWETRFLPRKNVILYSKLSGHTNWNQYSKSTINNGGVGGGGVRGRIPISRNVPSGIKRNLSPESPLP